MTDHIPELPPEPFMGPDQDLWAVHLRSWRWVAFDSYFLMIVGLLFVFWTWPMVSTLPTLPPGCCRSSS